MDEQIYKSFEEYSMSTSLNRNCESIINLSHNKNEDFMKGFISSFANSVWEHALRAAKENPKLLEEINK